MPLQIKICGITNVADGRAAAAAGADLIGFIFYPQSPRYISPNAARTIAHLLPPEIRKVGVFVDAGVSELQRIGELCALDVLQLHGSEPPGVLARLTEFEVFKALTVKSTADLDRFDAYGDITFVVDAACPEHGGSGQLCDWPLAAAAAKRHRVLLAGGLTVENVADAVRQVCPHGLDVSTGVERLKGLKDHDRIRAFIDAARAAEP